MSEIVRGRTKGYMTIENFIEDGLLEIGSIDLAGFYGALKRFIDRRNDETGKAVMPWTIDMFCRKFKIGKQRFYKLSEKLWQVGLLDVEKEFGLINPEKNITGWRNLYVVHDYPDYEGPLRKIRSGSYKYKKDSGEEKCLNLTENQGIESIQKHENKKKNENCSEQEKIADLEDEGEVPYRNTTKQKFGGSSNTGIPTAGIPAVGISAAERYIKDKGSKKQEIDNTINQSSIHHDDDNRARAKAAEVEAVDNVDFVDNVSGGEKSAKMQSIRAILKNAGFEGLPVEVDYISSWVDMFPREMIVYAINKAVLNGKKSLPYIVGIFENWLIKGVKTIAQAREETRYDSVLKQSNEGNKQEPVAKLPNPQVFTDYLARRQGGG